MEIKIIIGKKDHPFGNGEYLHAQIYIDGNYFKEVIPEQDSADIEQLLECVNHSLLNDEDFKNIKLWS